MRTILSSPATGRGSYYNAVPFSVGFYDISHELKTFYEVKQKINGLLTIYCELLINVVHKNTYVRNHSFKSFTTKGCIIAGQYPVQGAGIDLIRLLVDQDCSSLVLTYPLSEIPHVR